MNQNVSNLDLDAKVSYNSGTGQITSDGCTSNMPINWDYWNDTYHYWPYPSYVVVQSKTEQAFKIVAKLLEKKIIKELTVIKFIELVNDISNII